MNFCGDSPKRTPPTIPCEGAVTQDMEVEALLERNKSWAAKIKDINPDFFNVIAQSQSPSYLWIGCSDSRVPAEQVLGLAPGTLFVHRNIANSVNNQDVSCHSVLHYAIEVLKVKHILICGHYNCGGVKAAMQNTHYGFIDHWLRNIRDVYRLHKDELDAISDMDARERRLVELNVIEQCCNVYKTGVFQRTRLQTFRDPTIKTPLPRIHPFVFDPSTGHVNKLKVDWEKIIPSLRDVYNLYEDTNEDAHFPHNAAK